MSPSPTQVIVGVGFVPYGLPELLKHDYKESNVALIFPFPPGPPQVQRNWEFVHEIEKIVPLKDERAIKRINALDVPGCFDCIERLTNHGESLAVLAPYGPKPHALAMCLAAIKHGYDVYYTQPRYYNSQYSTGVAENCGVDANYAYAIKLRGEKYY
ncbi:hypothetical protein [Salinisphaera shabanensis]|uniref:hypothetical protein n=1 Tax=Salinisphaera shabanensis TaxID=180542 RepID=UPI00333F019A